MWILRKIFLTLTLLTLLESIAALDKDAKKKLLGNQKRAVDSYSYPLPSVRFDEKSSGSGKTKVIVETIKSISPPEYLPPSGYQGGSPVDSNVENLQAPLGSVSYNAFEADANKKSDAASTSATASSATVVPAKKRPGGLSSYRYYSPGGAGSSPTAATSVSSSSISPAPVRTSSVEPATTLSPGYQYTSRPVSTVQSSGTVTIADKPIKISSSTKAKPTGYNYSPPKVTKKPTRLEPKHADSKPEETGFTGYHYDVGSLSYEAPTKHTGPQPGMMGASFMRLSSPYYNFNVMLD